MPTAANPAETRSIFRPPIRTGTKVITLYYYSAAQPRFLTVWTPTLRWYQVFPYHLW